MKKQFCAPSALVAATAIAAAFLCAGCNDGGVKSGGGDAVAFLKHFSDAAVIEDDGSETFTDARDGQTYKKTTIGKQTWMAENLNYVPPSGNSWCYEFRPDSCAKYGRLYDWATAMGLDASYNSKEWGGRDDKSKKVCPAGWRLPSGKDWEKLMLNFCRTVDDCSLMYLTADDGWNNGGGMDMYGFSALPGGGVGRDGDYLEFAGVGEFGVWWTTEDVTGWGQYSSIGLGGSYANTIYLEGSAYILPIDKMSGFSVRCIRGN